MKNKLLLGLLVAGAALAPLAANAQLISINVGDRPYYNHGPRYFSGGRHHVWVPGHWTRHHRVWVHGHYGVADNGRRWR